MNKIDGWNRQPEIVKEAHVRTREQHKQDKCIGENQKKTNVMCDHWWSNYLKLIKEWRDLGGI